MDKLMEIRRDDRCAACTAELPAGTTAYWIRTERIVRCVPCQTGTDDGRVAVAVAVAGPGPSGGTIGQQVRPGPPPPSIGDAPRRDSAGESAQREYDKRSTRELAKKQQQVAEDAEWRDAIKEQRPVLGRIASALTPKPQITPESQATKAWKVGAEGERRVAEVLEGARGIEVLHDRLVPGSRANIDHLAIGPSGVFVIDAKKYTGQVEARDVGGLFRTDVRLYVNNRDRTKIVDGVLRQVDVVRLALGSDFADVGVQGVLCFVGCEWGWIMRTKRVKGVTALWPAALPEHVSVAGGMSDRVTAIADRLRSELRPAT
ncbi:nuclease-related domain-containing protein [Ilumatobacter sp.]|uniref:nuclease-related domain-containing protein n=1 Tax=Ilumatobacter sp. TaxID=1967498 RepID=UPI0037523D7D